jgi:hypothetical protein
MALTNSVLITDNVAGTQVNQRTCTVDTASNEWVAAQGTGLRIYLLGLDWSETTTNTLTIQSAANTIAVYECATTRWIYTNYTPPIFTNLNEALNITSTAAGVLRITWTTDQRIAYRLRVI